MKVYHILNSCQVKVFLFFIFYMVREQVGRKLPIQNVSYQQPRGCKNCKSGFLCLTQPAFTRRPWRGNASPVLPCTCAAVYLLQFQQPLSSFVQTHWMGKFSARLLPYTVTIIYNKKQTVIMSGQLNFTVCSILISQTPNRHNPNS